eukprot:CAMPEP_0169102328 /NCGR_PEP_ID=MMETSP1015-20121227/22106_1 /TAXON_ID=342587 /ORGANISM="Karlodinium micrum, Strain CCMP2283" /LENGTH=651 /DNA_ID=CAMNT_0009163417 /DNA_START=99 /DNA_END=2054 /DNA_ORIENTATION=+
MAAGGSAQTPSSSSSSKAVGRRIAGSSSQKLTAKRESSPTPMAGGPSSRSKTPMNARPKGTGIMINDGVEAKATSNNRRSSNISVPPPSKTPPRRRTTDAPAAADSGAGPSSGAAPRINRRSSPPRSRQSSPIRSSSASYSIDLKRNSPSKETSTKQRVARGGSMQGRVASQASPVSVEGSPLRSRPEIAPPSVATEFGTVSDTSMFAKDLASALTEIESRVVEHTPNLSLHESPMFNHRGVDSMTFGSDCGILSSSTRHRTSPASVTHEDRVVASQAFDRLFDGLGAQDPGLAANHRLFGGSEMSSEDFGQGKIATGMACSQPVVGCDSPPTLRCPRSARSHHPVASGICALSGAMEIQPAVRLEEGRATSSNAKVLEENHREQPNSLLRAAEVLRRETLELGKALEFWAVAQADVRSKSSNDEAENRRVVDTSLAAHTVTIQQANALPLMAQTFPAPVGYTCSSISPAVVPYMVAPTSAQTFATSQLRPLSPLGTRTLDARLPSPIPPFTQHLGCTPAIAQGNVTLQPTSSTSWMQNSSGQVEVVAASAAPRSLSPPLVYRTPAISSWDYTQQWNVTAPRTVSPGPPRWNQAASDRGASQSFTFGSATSTIDFANPLLEASWRSMASLDTKPGTLASDEVASNTIPDRT